MNAQQSTLRKAAILVASLDVESADQLLAQMTPEQEQLVRQTMASLGDTDMDEQADVIEEFFRIGPFVPEKELAGVELDAGLAARLQLPTTPSAAQLKSHSPAVESPSFDFLLDADMGEIAATLRQEHPQMIAVVAAHLTPERAAALLGQMPPDLQAEVARRLIDLEETAPEVLRDLERGLEARLSTQVRGQMRRKAGMAALQNILEVADQRVQSEILANLSRRDEQLAVRLAPPPRPALTFNDLARLNDAALSAVLLKAEWEIKVLALAGADANFVERALALLPAEEADALSYDLDYLGPTRLSDVEQAQEELAAVAEELDRHRHSAPRTNQRLSVAV